MNLGEADSRLWVLSQSLSPMNGHGDDLKMSLSAESGSAGQGGGGGGGAHSRFISNKLPGDAGTAGPRRTF